MNDVYFNDQSLSIVDEWMGLSKDILQTEDSGCRNTVTEEEMVNRKGLGNKYSKKNHTDDALAVRLRVNDKRKKNVENYEQEVDLHGVVDEEFYDNKISSIAIRKTSNAFKNKSKIVKNQDAVIETSKVSDKLESNIFDSEKINDTDKSNNFEKNLTIDKLKIKRPKTRSKQKNIRRDNRPESEKPNRLWLGSREYAGRPLSQQTKIFLGLTGNNKLKLTK